MSYSNFSQTMKKVKLITGFFLVNSMVYLFFKFPAFEIEVLSTFSTKCRSQFTNFQFALTIHWKKICQKLSRNLCISCQQWLRHTSAFCQELWFVFFTVDTTYSTYITLFTYNTLKHEKQKTIFLPLITLFCFLCVLVIIGKYIIQR